MKLTVNDESKDVREGSNLHELLIDLDMSERKGLAVAVNQTVIPAANWSTQPLSSGDQILIIQATQGG